MTLLRLKAQKGDCLIFEQFGDPAECWSAVAPEVLPIDRDAAGLASAESVPVCPGIS